MPPGGRICLLRALPGLGDLLCAVPAIRAIRRARPDVAITLVTLPVALGVACRFRHLVDEVVPFPGFPGLPDRRPAIRQVPGFLAAMQARSFDLAVQLHGSGQVTNEVVALLGARVMAGYRPLGASAPDVDEARFPEWREDEPEVRRWLRLVGLLGYRSDDARLELPLVDDADAQLDALLATVGAGGTMRARPVAVVHPGASTPERRWPAEAFADVGRRLARAGLAVAVTGGVGERPLTAEVARLAGPDALDLGGRTTLDALGALVRRASVVVANDTGVAHVADALGTPSVVLFTATDPARWAALDRRRHVPLLGGSAATVAEAALGLVRAPAPHAA